MKNNYFLVETKCGHVGRNFYIPKFIPIIAPTARDAAEKARWTPRAKHHDKFAILSVIPISEEEYHYHREIMQNDPYFHCSCIQDQKEIEEYILENRIPMEHDEVKRTKEKSRRKEISKRYLFKEVYQELIEFESDYDSDYEYNFA